VISLIEALNYRCLHYVRQELGAFHLLVGPNASGKTTFLDVLGFLHDFVTRGENTAVESRSSNFYDLLWQHEGCGFELAVEAPIPESLRDSLEDKTCTSVRYEVAFRLDQTENQLEIVAEQAVLKADSESPPGPPHGAPEALVEQGLIDSDDRLSPRCLFARCRAHEGHYDAHVRSVNWSVQVNTLHPKGSLLGSIFQSQFFHPVCQWLRWCLSEGIEWTELDAQALRNPSPPGQGTRIGSDGSNVPWVIAELERKSPEQFHDWVQHLRTALPDLADLTTIERPEDRHRYLALEYQGGLAVPSWMASDGTLRLLALTLPAYLPDLRGAVLVEEPENSLHPLAIETVYQSLSSVYDGQVLLATHSPLFVAIAKPSEVLCFTKDPEGATQIVSGDRHPELADWRGEIDLGTLFASGVLG
jgi:predicted ATPase